MGGIFIFLQDVQNAAGGTARIDIFTALSILYIDCILTKLIENKKHDQFLVQNW